MNKENNRNVIEYIIFPILFLTVALLGGLRISSQTNAFVFFKPSLICLILASMIFVSFGRSKLIEFNRWFSEDFSLLHNCANSLILLTIFAATTQIFNSLLPETGLPFFLLAFLFFWTLWNNLFIDFTPLKLLQSMAGLFGLAFVAKYLILMNFSPAEESGWAGKIIQTALKEASFGLLELPRFAPSTGYLQFFTLVLFALSLTMFYLMESKPSSREISETTS